MNYTKKENFIYFLHLTRHIFYVLILSFGSLLDAFAQTMPTAQTLPYYEDFTSLTGSTPSYPAGWQGWQITSSKPTSTGSITSPASDRTIYIGTAANSTTGVYDYTGKIGFLSGSTADIALCLAVNTTGFNTVKVTFDAMTIRSLYDGTNNDIRHGLVLQYRVGESGDFTPLSYYPNEYLSSTTTQTIGTTGIDVVTGLNAILPSACDDQPIVQIRWIYRTAAGSKGSRPTMALDNIVVNEYQPILYTWNQTGTASYATAANWTPARTNSDSYDILQINGGGSVVITDVPTQAIGQLLISNNTTVELQSTAAATLTIAGYTGTDLTIESGSALNIAQTTNAITVAVGTGATGSISGTMTFSNTAHKLTAANASGITFQNGSSFTAGTGFSENAFGGSSSVANSVVFNSGSTYIAVAGSNPFARTQPSSVVVFNSGSLYKVVGNTTPSLSGRTYADLEIDAAAQTFSVTGSAPVSINNLTVTNGVLNINLTNSGNAIKGNITVEEGATLTFSPASASTINFNGTSTQTISGSGTLTVGSFSDFVIANNVILDKNITIGGALTLNSTKALTVNAGKQLTVNTAFTNNGTLNLLSSSANGTATILPPASITGSGITTVQQYLSNTRNWYVSSPVTGAVAPAGYSYFQRDEAGSSWTSLPFVAGNTFVAGKGYIALPAAAASTLVFSGTLNNANVDVTLTKSGSGFNLIGNPYPCHLGWTYDFVNANALLVESSIWVRTNAGTTNNSNQWSFVTFNATSAETVPLVANAGVIAPMQAFWVKAKAPGTLTLDNNLTRSHQSSNPLKAPAVKNSDRQRIRLQVSNGLATDESLIYFDANASNAFDAYDSPKMTNNSLSVPEIYTIVNGESLVINGMKNFEFDTEIPLGFMTKQAGSFTLQANQIINIQDNARVFLKDKMNSDFEKELTESEAYYFNSDITNTTERFSIIFRSAGSITSKVELNIDSLVHVYSSVDNYITVVCEEGLNDYATATVYNSTGQKIHEQSLSNNTTKLNLKFNKGVHLIKVKFNGRDIVRKVII